MSLEGDVLSLLLEYLIHPEIDLTAVQELFPEKKELVIAANNLFKFKATTWTIESSLKHLLDPTTTVYQKVIYCAKHGFISALKWIDAAYHVTPEIVRERSNYALRSSVRYGHVEMVKYLTAQYGLTAEDARQDNKCILLAVKSKKPEMVRLLQTDLQLERQDVLNQIEEIFSFIISQDLGEILQILKSHYKITMADLRGTGGYFLHPFLLYNRLELLKILHSVFGMSREDLRGQTIKPAEDNEAEAILQWFYVTYNIS